MNETVKIFDAGILYILIEPLRNYIFIKTYFNFNTR